MRLLRGGRHGLDEDPARIGLLCRSLQVKIGNPVSCREDAVSGVLLCEAFVDRVQFGAVITSTRPLNRSETRHRPSCVATPDTMSLSSGTPSSRPSCKTSVRSDSTSGSPGIRVSFASRPSFTAVSTTRLPWQASLNA